MNAEETRLAILALLGAASLVKPELALLEIAVDRALLLAAAAKKARDEGRSMTEEEVDAFFVAYNSSTVRAKEAYERAVAEGR
jgi:hypothetical protein